MRSVVLNSSGCRGHLCEAGYKVSEVAEGTERADMSTACMGLIVITVVHTRRAIV